MRISRRFVGVLLAFAAALPVLLAWSLGCGRASQVDERRPANAGLLLLSRSSLEGALKPVG